MELAQIGRTLRARWPLTLLVVVIAAGGAAAIKLKKPAVPTGTATAQLMVDSPQSALADLRQDTIPLTTRASVFAQFMASSLIQQRIAAVLGVPTAEITTEGPFSVAGQSLNAVTPSEARGPQLTATKKLYRLTFVAQDQLPLVTVSAQAPTGAQAAKLADAVYPAVSGYLQGLQKTATPPSGLIPFKNRVTLRQLGPSQVGSENSHGAIVLMAAAFAGLLLFGLLTILAIEKARPKRRRATATAPIEAEPRPAVNGSAGREHFRPRHVEDDDALEGVDMSQAFPYDSNGTARRDVDSPHTPSPIG